MTRSRPSGQSPSANEARSGEGNEYGRTRSVSPATPEGTFRTAARSRSTAARARSSLVGALGDDAASIERETSTTKTTSESARTERSPPPARVAPLPPRARGRRSRRPQSRALSARESGTSPTARATWRDRRAETTAATSGRTATSPTSAAHGILEGDSTDVHDQYPVPGGEEPAPPRPPGARPPGGTRMPATTRMRRSFSRFRFAFTFVGSATIADWNRPSAASTLPSVARENAEEVVRARRETRRAAFRHGGERAGGARAGARPRVVLVEPERDVLGCGEGANRPSEREVVVECQEPPDWVFGEPGRRAAPVRPGRPRPASSEHRRRRGRPPPPGQGRVPSRRALTLMSRALQRRRAVAAISPASRTPVSSDAAISRWSRTRLSGTALIAGIGGNGECARTVRAARRTSRGPAARGRAPRR